MPPLTYQGYEFPPSAEVVALTRVPVCDDAGVHLYDECTLHVKVPPGADWGPRVAPVPKELSPGDKEAIAQLRVAVRESCAGAVYCKVRTVHNHVVANAGRFRVLNDLTYAEMCELATKHLTVTSVKGELFVG